MASSAAAASTPRRVKDSQAVAKLLFGHQVYRSASTKSPLRRWLPAHTPLTGERTTLPPGGPYVLALSARSNVLQDFDGGPGQIGIHGRDLLGGTLGQAESHGCMRLDGAAITWLAARIGPGVPVNILG